MLNDYRGSKRQLLGQVRQISLDKETPDHFASGQSRQAQTWGAEGVGAGVGGAGHGGGLAGADLGGVGAWGGSDEQAATALKQFNDG